MKHTLVFSDLHLTLEAPDKGVWMRFRQRRFFIDGDFGRLVDRLLDQVADTPFEVVFNGDTFELDGANAYARGADERPEDLGNEPSEALGLDRILRDHPGFVAALGRLLVRAERIVFVTGNHDLGLHWPTSRHVLRRHLVRAAQDAGSRSAPPALRERLVFAPWFHRTPDGVYIEHGQQFDPASATPDPMMPTRDDGRGLWQSFGSAGYRHVLGGIGTMNPHNGKSFILGGVTGYAHHFFRYYFGRRRSILKPWLLGSIRCARHMLAQRADHSEPGTAARWDGLARLADQTALSAHQLRRLRGLWVRPVSDRPYAILRELWLDRVALVTLALLVIGFTALLAPGWITLLVLALVVGALLTYERLAPDNDLDAYQDGLCGKAAQIARITGDEVVVLGHTHRPHRARLANGGTLLNTGSWAPSFADPECTQPVDSHRTFAWIRTDGGRLVSANLLTWQDDRISAFDPCPTPRARVAGAPAAATAAAARSGLAQTDAA